MSEIKRNSDRFYRMMLIREFNKILQKKAFQNIKVFNYKFYV
jgi:hypothetical protein